MTTLNVLVVDDDDAIRKLIKTRLEMAGYTVDTAPDGVQAIKRFDQQSYQVVISDLLMPGGVSGMDVLDAAKKIDPDCAVILLTGFATVDNAIEAMKKGAADFLQKPVNLDELVLRLDKISNLNALIKDANDLREAMDATEKNAAETISSLEMRVTDLEKTLKNIQQALSSGDAQRLSHLQQDLAGTSNAPANKEG